MEGPYTADMRLQVVCYFKYTPEGAKKMTGAPVELDKRLGGVIASLRERGEFVGDEGEALLLTPPKDSIEAKALLLVGLGDEDALSLKVMERVGRVSLREAARLGVSRVAFAPLIRDQASAPALGSGLRLLSEFPSSGCLTSSQVFGRSPTFVGLKSARGQEIDGCQFRKRRCAVHLTNLRITPCGWHQTCSHLV